jgi:hypothetical protein
MATEVVITGAKRAAVLGIRPRPTMWKSIVASFDKEFRGPQGLLLQEWLDIHSEWEVKDLSYDSDTKQWVLVGQRPLG